MGSVGDPQCHDKPASLTVTFAARLDTTSLAPHKIADDEQTQPETRHRALGISASAVEALEDLPQFAGWDTNATVGNVDGNATISGAGNGDFHLNGFIGVFDGVLQKIAKDNGKLGAVATNDRLARSIKRNRVAR